MRANEVLGEEELSYPEFGRKKDEGSSIDGGAIAHNALGKILSIREGDALFLFMEKFFRRIRVRLMKIENFLTSLVDRLHEKSLEKKSGFSSDDSGNSNTLITQELGDNPEFDEQYWLDVLKQDTKSVYPYKKLGDIYSTRQDFRQARLMFGYALKLNPDDSEAKAKIEKLRGKRTNKG